MTDKLIHIDGYEGTLAEIGALLESVRQGVARAVNTAMATTYWEIGRRVIELEQKGAERALYGEGVVMRLAGDLTRRYGRGFSRRNIYNFREFYLWKRIVQTPSAQSFPLSWSHYVRLLSVQDADARAFYESAAMRGGWTARQLDRQVGAKFYERHHLASDQAAVLASATQPVPTDAISPEAAIKDPYVLEFLDLKDEYSESDLEEALIQDLESFLLELGNDFTFVGRQKRLLIGTSWYRVDLVFFHRGLRCLVLIDLKTDALSHGDVGQMNLYVNYAAREWTRPDENQPIGLILCASKDETLARYALANLPQIKAAEYTRVLPDEKLLAQRMAERRRLLIETHGGDRE